MDHHDNDISEIELAAYLDGRLDRAQLQRFEHLLGSNAEMGRTATIARTVVLDNEDNGNVPRRLEQQAVALYPVNRGAIDLVISLAKGVISVIRSSPAITLAEPMHYAVVRKQAQERSSFLKMTRTFDQTRFNVHIEHDGRSSCAFIIQAEELADDSPLKHGRVDLVSGQRQLASNPFDDGSALFEDVLPGQYDLIIHKNKGIVGIMSIKIIGA